MPHFNMLAGFAFGLALSTSAWADDVTTRAITHAPIGVMGDHLHDKGEFMLSYRYMRMDMEGNRIGTSEVSPETIVTTVPNRFFGAPMQPPTLRIVPTDMTMDMHMFGLMYAPTDRITLMGMANYIVKEMDHITFMGPSGTMRLGNFTTESKGWGDTTLSALIGLLDSKQHKLHLNAGISLPTGSIKETDTILTPLGTMPTVRLPYAMQLGSGTYDLKPGITYNGFSGRWNWGAQYSGEIRIDENDQDYALGDVHKLTGWVAYAAADWVSLSGRIDAETRDDIDGLDFMIMGPVQTADPNNYGGEKVSLILGANFAVQSGILSDHRFALEVGMPVMQDLNGPQMESDWSLTIGWQKAF